MENNNLWDLAEAEARSNNVCHVCGRPATIYRSSAYLEAIGAHCNPSQWWCDKCANLDFEES